MPPKSKKLPSIIDALIFLEKSGCNPNIIYHCLQVARKSYEIANKVSKQPVNVALVYLGGLFHDIGRSKSHGITHAVLGAELVYQQYQLPELSRIIECHIGGGLDLDEARLLKLPLRDYLPKTLEEKIVCYADKLFQYEWDKNFNLVTWRETATAAEEIEKLRVKHGEQHKSHQRLAQLEIEIQQLLTE